MFSSVPENWSVKSPYAEREFAQEKWLDRYFRGLAGAVKTKLRPARRAAMQFVRRVNAQEAEIGVLSDAQIKERLAALSQSLRQNGLREELVASSFAILREISARTLGLRHYDVQLMGGWALLRGTVAEMETGEGKTLTATLAVATAALAGIPTHVVTVNDYLARRDADQLTPLYAYLGLRVGVVVSGMSPQARRAAYRCDITYCTNKELIFDYLKDRARVGNAFSYTRALVKTLAGEHSIDESLILNGLHFAVVDEADSVLIDEARVPAIITEPSSLKEEAAAYQIALELAKQMVGGEHFKIDYSARTIKLTAAGKQRLATVTEPMKGDWKRRQWREEMVKNALSAVFLFIRDRHYLVDEGKIKIVDEFTGRTMEDRSWEQGLHQLVEAKEGVELTGRRQVIAKTSYQRFFRRYLRLSGMTGTAREVSSELRMVYGVEVFSIPTNRRVKRAFLGEKVVPTEDNKWRRVADRCVEMQRSGKPVLVGTRTVEASERISALLTSDGVEHCVLNAKQDKAEAEIIYRAGKSGNVTIATNMAGRGTDIKLCERALAAGGLHVIVTEKHESARIDRQLIGRCGRQGEPGTYEIIVSLEDEIVRNNLPKAMSDAVFGIVEDGGIGGYFARKIARYAQRKTEHKHIKLRKQLLNIDESQDRTLAFTGNRE